MVRRARTNFNALELMCSMPDDAQVIMDAMREGRGQREAARQHMGGGGLISQVVANALGQLPSMVDSSTMEGALTPSLYTYIYIHIYICLISLLPFRDVSFVEERLALSDNMCMRFLRPDLRRKCRDCIVGHMATSRGVSS